MDPPSHSSEQTTTNTTPRHHNKAAESIATPIPCQPTKQLTTLAFAEPSPAMPLISSFSILTRGLRIRQMQPSHFHFHAKIPPPWPDSSPTHSQGMANLKQPSKLLLPSIAALGNIHQLAASNEANQPAVTAESTRSIFWCVVGKYDVANDIQISLANEHHLFSLLIYCNFNQL